MKIVQLTGVFLAILLINSILLPFLSVASTNSIAEGKSLSIYSVKNENPKSTPDCFNYYGECVVLGENEPLLVINDFTYEIIDAEKPGFVIFLSNDEQEKLHTISKNLVGKKMALALEENILHIGKVKRVIDSDRLQVTFCNKRNYQTILSYFSGELKILPNDIKCDC